MDINTYLKRLAAKSPTPGGGSAAALVGAIGISLLSMTARYVKNGMPENASKAKLSLILRFTERSYRRLIELMREDELSYLRLSKALKRKSLKDFRGLYKGAAIPPFEICSLLHEGIKNCEELYPYCKKCLITDLAEATLFLEAGFLSARLNVEANLNNIRNEPEAKKMRHTLARQIINVHAAKKRIFRKTVTYSALP